MKPVAAPHFRELTPAESHAFLVRQHVGRIAYSVQDRVDIEPISFVADGEWIFGRTGHGAKLSRLAHHPWCAFEVDEVHNVFDWTSVVVKGSFYLLDPETGADTYLRALSLLRDMVPQTFLAGDPTPQRSMLFGIYVNEITGRSALLSTAQ